MSTNSRDSKVRHVLSSEVFDTAHVCHWPGCKEVVKPAMWGCKKHWMTLPKKLREALWEAYEPGQEVTKKPSAQYRRVAKEIREWIYRYIASETRKKVNG